MTNFIFALQAFKRFTSSDKIQRILHAYLGKKIQSDTQTIVDVLA